MGRVTLAIITGMAVVLSSQAQAAAGLRVEGTPFVLETDSRRLTSEQLAGALLFIREKVQ